MDGDPHQRRLYGQQNFARTYSSGIRNQAQNATEPNIYHGNQDPRSVQSSSVSQGYRAPQLAQTQSLPSQTISTASNPRHELTQYAYAQYTGQPLQGAALQYNPRYTIESQGPLQVSPYTSQPLAQNIPQQTQSPHDARPRYQSRQDAATMEVLDASFGPPDMSSYYESVDPTGTSGAPSLSQQFGTTAYQQQRAPSYQTVEVENQNLPSNYVTAQMDTYNQPESSAHQSQQQEQAVVDLSAQLESYQTQLKQTFGAIKEGRLVEACESLLHNSEWLLGNVRELGFTRDTDPSKTQERRKIWNEFNLCWLALLQGQMDMTKTKFENAGQLPAPKSTLSADKLKEVGDRLIEWCNSLEPYGLVDYQMGVWEEEIESSRPLITDCEIFEVADE